MGQRFRRMEDQKPGPVCVAHNHDFAEDLKKKIFRRVRRSIPGLQILLAPPPSLIEAHAVKSFFARWVQVFIKK